MVAPRHRIGYIDGLRAVAVLTVVASHSVMPSQFGQSFGVTLFFVLSGFCLSYPTLVKIHERGRTDYDVYRYAAHRLTRILPPYYVAIILLVGCAIFVPGFTRVPAVDVVRQALFLDARTVFLTGPFWSLPVEFRWYFLFPVAMWLWVRSPRAFLAATFAIVVAGQATRATSVDLVVLPAFLSGVVAAHLQIIENRLARFALPFCALVMAIAYLRTGTVLNIAWEAAAFLLVVGSGAQRWVSSLLSMKWLTSVGLVSYSIYLIHAPVITFAEQHGVTPILAAGIGIAFGYAFWYVAERPFVEGAVRARLIVELETVFAKWFPRIGLGRLMAIAAGPALAASLQLRPEPYQLPPDWDGEDPAHVVAGGPF